MSDEKSDCKIRFLIPFHGIRNNKDFISDIFLSTKFKNGIKEPNIYHSHGFLSGIHFTGLPIKSFGSDNGLFHAVSGFLINFFFALFIAGCGISQPIQPIDKGSTAITASLGGPVIPLDGLAIPAPYLNLGAIHGIEENFSLYGNAHVTAALFKDIGVDGGFVTCVIKEDGIVPAVSVNGRLNFFWDIGRSNNARIFPQATLLAHYKTGERSLFYVGADNFFQVHKFDYLLSPLFGYQFPLSGPMNSLVEVRWLAANKDTRHGVFEGATSVAGNGGAGIYIGIQYLY